MTQKSNRNFLNEIYSKPPERNYNTNKTDVYHNVDKWSSYIRPTGLRS